MRTLLVLITIALNISSGCFAQDTIIKHNGDIILATISEINPSEIRYKRYGFSDGPSYVETKSEISMISYSTGLRETFSPGKPAVMPEYAAPKPSEDRRIIALGRSYARDGKKYNEAYIFRTLLNTKDVRIKGLVAESKKAKGMQYIGFAAIPLGLIGLLAVGQGGALSSPDRSLYHTLGAVCIGSAIACPIASGIFKKHRQNRLAEAIKLYNQTL
ncbi:MAG TPA: hypothetical protein VF868_09200 [Bacteroidia bacterium]|jgi:hypothetical protein